MTYQLFKTHLPLCRFRFRTSIDFLRSFDGIFVDEVFSIAPRKSTIRMPLS